ncbi:MULTISPECIES: hypothetical protein [Microcoleaceae]|nr:hypothetical protein [Tychonema sp. LEGE 06208]
MINACFHVLWSIALFGNGSGAIFSPSQLRHQLQGLYDYRL